MWFPIPCRNTDASAGKNTVAACQKGPAARTAPEDYQGLKQSCRRILVRDNNDKKAQEKTRVVQEPPDEKYIAIATIVPGGVGFELAQVTAEQGPDTGYLSTATQRCGVGAPRPGGPACTRASFATPGNRHVPHVQGVC